MRKTQAQRYKKEENTSTFTLRINRNRASDGSHCDGRGQRCCTEVNKDQIKVLSYTLPSNQKLQTTKRTLWWERLRGEDVSLAELQCKEVAAATISVKGKGYKNTEAVWKHVILAHVLLNCSYETSALCQHVNINSLLFNYPDVLSLRFLHSDFLHQIYKHSWMFKNQNHKPQTRVRSNVPTFLPVCNRAVERKVLEQVDDSPPAGDQSPAPRDVQWCLSAALGSVSLINSVHWQMDQTLSPVLLLSPRAWTTSTVRPLFRVLLTATHKNTH